MKRVKEMKVSYSTAAWSAADYEDLAEFTEANTRMPLGKNANRLAARRLKGEIGEMIDEVYVVFMLTVADLQGSRPGR